MEFTQYEKQLLIGSIDTEILNIIDSHNNNVIRLKKWYKSQKTRGMYLLNEPECTHTIELLNTYKNKINDLTLLRNKINNNWVTFNNNKLLKINF